MKLLVMFDVVEVIRTKRDGKKLKKNQIYKLIDEYLKGNVTEYQMSALLMAGYIRGFSDEETFYLTSAMLESGRKFDFSEIDGIKFDKHSTGGVGDKVSFIVSPLIALLGFYNPMMAGRGLGHTGGTIDKLESIDGYSPQIDEKEIVKILKKNKAAIFSQSKKIAPADKKLYALRDVTGTVESIPLIAASIVSKKMAEDISGIIYDVKVGNGAFINSRKKANKLATLLVKISKKFNVRAHAVISDMNQILGYSAGNAIEIKEVIEFMKKDYDIPDLKKISYRLTYELLKDHLEINKDEFFKKCDNLLNKGYIYEKFKKMVFDMGGKTKSFEDVENGNFIKKVFEYRSKNSGYLNEVDTYLIGKTITLMGGGRNKLGEKINHNVGIEFFKKIGDKVDVGDLIVKVFYDNEDTKREVVSNLNRAIVLGEKCEKKQIIYNSL